AVGLRPLPPAALTGPRAPGRPAGCLVPGRALLVAVPLVRAAVLVAVVLADDDPEDDDPDDDEEDRAGAADLAGRADLAGLALAGVVLAAGAAASSPSSSSMTSGSGLSVAAALLTSLFSDGRRTSPVLMLMGPRHGWRFQE